PRFRCIVPATRGLIAALWTPASLGLCSGGNAAALGSAAIGAVPAHGPARGRKTSGTQTGSGGARFLHARYQYYKDALVYIVGARTMLPNVDKWMQQDPILRNGICCSRGVAWAGVVVRHFSS